MAGSVHRRPAEGVDLLRLRRRIRIGGARSTPSTCPPEPACRGGGRRYLTGMSTAAHFLAAMTAISWIGYLVSAAPRLCRA